MGELDEGWARDYGVNNDNDDDDDSDDLCDIYL